MNFEFSNMAFVCSWAVNFIRTLSAASPIILFITALLVMSIVTSIILFRKKWAKVTLLKVIYVFVALVIGFALFFLFIPLYSQILLIQCELPKADGTPKIGDTDIRNLAIAFLGTISGLGALFAVYIAILRSETTERQTHTAEQGLITERINKATKGLGENNEKDNPVVEVRLGALYALERIAQDSIRDHIQIIEILCAYIRTNSPLKSKQSKAKKLREDIQAALTIIGRRGNWQDGKKNLKKEKEQGYRIDLRSCDLRGAQLNKANMADALLGRTNLSGAHLYKANLSDAWLDNADMSNTMLEKAILDKAQLDDANLSRSDIKNATLKNASLYGANLSDARLISADLTGARLINADMSDTFLYSANLSEASINRANLNNAWLENANLKDTDTDSAYAYTGDFSKCKHLTKKQLNNMFCGRDFIIPDKFERPAFWATKRQSYNEFEKAYRGWYIKD